MLKVEKVIKLNGNGSSLKAFADIVLGEKVLVRNVKVIESKKGKLFAALPNQQSKDGKYYEIIVFLDEELKELLQKEVLKAYEAKAS